MARSPAEIQADIALTRQRLERTFQSLERGLRRWWMPYALVGAGLALGLVLARIPLLRLIGAGARTVRAGVAVAGSVGAVDRFLAARRRAA